MDGWPSGEDEKMGIRGGSSLGMGEVDMIARSR
jgi:hypothetical protein